MGKIQSEINRVEKICALCYANKTSANRFKFAQYSEILKKVKSLFAQRKQNSQEFKGYYNQLKSFV